MPDFKKFAIENPDLLAIQYPKQSFTYSQLYAYSHSFASQFKSLNLPKDASCLILIPPQSITLITVLLSLTEFIGALPVLIHPGMGIHLFLKSVRKANPDYVISIWYLTLLLKIGFSLFGIRSEYISVWPSDSAVYRLLSKLEIIFGKSVLLTDQTIVKEKEEEVKPSTNLLCIYTSGSTGLPKPVLLSRSQIEAQSKLIHELYPYLKEEKKIIVAVIQWLLLTIFVGLSAIVPEGLGKPKEMDPEKIWETCLSSKSQTIFASPVVFHNFALYLNEKQKYVPLGIKRMICGGMFVPYPTLDLIHFRMNQRQEFDLVYGSTEAQPICQISIRTLLKEEIREKSKLGFGMCLGSVCPSITLKILPLSMQLGDYEIGEIIVSGAVVSESYRDLELNEGNKFLLDGQLFHRTGDLGYMLNDQVWYLGRIKDCLHGTIALPSVGVEVMFTTRLKLIKSCALVKSVKNEPILVLIPKPDIKTTELIKKVSEIWKESIYGNVNLEIVVYSKEFPTDATHQTKIRRDLLAKMVESSIRYKLN